MHYLLRIELFFLTTVPSSFTKLMSFFFFKFKLYNLHYNTEKHNEKDEMKRRWQLNSRGETNQKRKDFFWLSVLQWDSIHLF